MDRCWRRAVNNACRVTPSGRYACFLHWKRTKLTAPSENVMKVLIIGRGVVGTIHGWALSKVGIDVTHVVRKEGLRCTHTLDLLD